MNRILTSLLIKGHGSASIFLSGNGPLVGVLNHVLGADEASGKTFAWQIKEWIPGEHVAYVHNRDGSGVVSEPEHFMEFAKRVPNRFVLVGLVGRNRRFMQEKEVDWLSGLVSAGKVNVPIIGMYMARPKLQGHSRRLSVRNTDRERLLV